MLALVGNVLVATTKVIAASVTGSSAMLSEAVHSIVDTANELLLLYGFRRASRRPDQIHPLGYGRELYFWSFVVALLIFALGAGVSLYEGWRQIVAPKAVENVGMNYLVLALAFLFEGSSFLVALSKLRAVKKRAGYWETIHRSKDPPSFMIVFEDSAALIGILIAGLGICMSDRTGRPEFDGVASVGIGLMLTVVAVVLARECKSLLIGERASPALISSITDLAKAESGVADAHDAITVHLAPDQILVALSVEFNDRLATPAIEAVVLSMEHRIRYVHPQVVTLFIKPQTKANFDLWKHEHFGV